MDEEIVDLLKIKIEKAKRNLPLETVNAIDAVNWRAAILGFRIKKGYTFEQLGDLETETELLLCGLSSPKDYPKELEKRMKITKSAANELVNEMNELVFKKIREELIKNTERKRTFRVTNIEPENTLVDVDREIGNIPTTKSVSNEPLSRNTKEEEAGLRKDGIEIIYRPTNQQISANPTDNNNLQEKGKIIIPINREEVLKKIEKPEEIHPILMQKLSIPTKTETIKTEHSLENITKTTPNSSTYPLKKDPYRLSPDE